MCLLSVCASSEFCTREVKQASTLPYSCEREPDCDLGYLYGNAASSGQGEWGDPVSAAGNRQYRADHKRDKTRDTARLTELNEVRQLILEEGRVLVKCLDYIGSL